MKSLLTFTLTLVITITTFGQDKLSTRSGVIHFAASTENFEPVAATNKTTSAILKDDGTLAVLGLIKGFQFKKKLMQEHFNQSQFIDSEQFPKTKFSGKITDYKNETGEYKIVGKLTIHGVTNEVSSLVSIKKIDGVTYLNTKFSVEVADYGIIIKSKLAKKIAEKVNIEVDLELK